jgi:type I restriction enzyme S subunit
MSALVAPLDADLAHGWSSHALRDIAAKIQDGTHFSPPLGGIDFKYITSKNIGPGYLKLDSVETISAEEHRKIYRRCDVRAGDLLLTKDGANTGNVAISTFHEEVSLLSSVAFIRADHRVAIETYLLQYLLCEPGQQQIADAMAGNAITRLTLGKINALVVPLPPIEEQRRIAASLADVDGLVANLERLIDKKQMIKQGMMQQLLTAAVRLPGYSDEWNSRSLRDNVSLVSGHHVPASDCNTRGSGVPYLTGPADFQGGRIRQTKFTTRPSTMCRRGDILVTVKGSGCGAMVRADASYCISRQLMAIRPNTWDSKFLFYSLHQNAASIRDAATGLIPGLSRADVLNQEIPVPSLAEQRAIATVFVDTDRDLDALHARLRKARDVKQGMMQQLLTGRSRLDLWEAAA